MRLKFLILILGGMGKRDLSIVLRRTCINMLQMYIHNNIYNVSIKTMAKMIDNVHALIIPQSTKKVKNLKFDFVTLAYKSLFPYPLTYYIIIMHS